MRITTKGQVTIPKAVREKAGLLPHTDVEFVMSGGNVLLKRKAGRNRRGAQMIEALRGKGTIKMTTDEIMALMRGD